MNLEDLELLADLKEILKINSIVGLEIVLIGYIIV